MKTIFIEQQGNGNSITLGKTTNVKERKSIKKYLINNNINILNTNKLSQWFRFGFDAMDQYQ